MNLIDRLRDVILRRRGAERVSKAAAIDRLAAKAEDTFGRIEVQLGASHRGDARADYRAADRRMHR